MAELPPLPPADRPATPAAKAGELPQQPRPVEAEPGKPDPRPMRVVYGAGAVAAVSVMAVGLIQPDFAATADQQPSTDLTSADQGRADAADAGSRKGNGQTDSDASQRTAEQVRHVIKYMQLKPGQTRRLAPR